VSAAEVGPSIERHLGNRRPQPLSKAATEVLAIIAYKQPITRAGIEHIRGANSDSALDTLLIRGLVELDRHHLLLTTRTFLDFAGLRDLADLPALPTLDAEEVRRDLLEAS
jgi:segregation and condensation protein B